MARGTLDNFIKLNIGLKKGRTNQDVPLADVHKELANRGFKTTHERVVTKQRAGGEPTAVIHARHTMPQADVEKAVHDMSGALGQDAIAYKNNHKGVLSGPRKENYGGHFNSKFFTEGRLAESRADEMPEYLYRIGAETGKDLHLYKTSRMAHGDTSRYKDHVFHLGIHSIPDDVKARIQKDYPEARLGLSSASQYAPEMRSPVIVMPGAKKRIHESRLDELSPETMQSYAKKRLMSIDKSLRAVSDARAAMLFPHSWKQTKGRMAKVASAEAEHDRRRGNLRKAMSHMLRPDIKARIVQYMNNESEALDELSPDTLASYLRHATVSHGSNTMRLGQEGVYNIDHNRPVQSGDEYTKAKKGADKRFSGIQTAISKLHRSAMHEDHVSRGDRVSVSDPEGDWTGRVFKPGRDSLFGGGASREDAMHQITPDPQHANRFPRSVVSVHPDAVHRVYEDHLDEISIDSLNRYMKAAISNELDAVHGAQDLRRQHRERSILPRLTVDHRANKLKSDMQALVDRAARRRKGVSLARERLALQMEGKDQ
jgi:hypothetical protein